MVEGHLTGRILFDAVLKVLEYNNINMLVFAHFDFLAYIMAYSSLNNQYYSMGIGALPFLGEIELKQSISTGVLLYSMVFSDDHRYKIFCF